MVHAAVVRLQEVQEALVVPLPHAEAGQKASIASTAGRQSESDQLPEISSRDVAVEQERADILPEATGPRCQLLVKVVGHSPAPLAPGIQRTVLQRSDLGWQVLDLESVGGCERGHLLHDVL